MSLKHQAFSAIRWTTLATAGKISLQFLHLVILARLLVPADFGLMALVSTLIAFTQLFADAGISMALIHRPQITEAQRSSLYWLNLLLSLGLMLLLMLISPVLAGLYQEPRLVGLLVAASLSLPIVASSQQLRFLAEKELGFALLARIELTAALAGFVAALSLAVLGSGVWSLVVGVLVSATVSSALSWRLLACGWRPAWRFNFKDTHEFLRFGIYLVGNDLANTFNAQADILLGGRLLSITELGLYSVPRDLSLRLGSIINPIVTRVGFPLMAKSQSDIAQLRSIYLQTLRMTASVNFPLYLALACFAPEVAGLLLGERWLPAADALRLLALWGMLRSTGNPVGSLLLARGCSARAFYWNFSLLFLIPPILWYSARFGSNGLATALLGIQVILVIPGWYFLVRPLCHARLGEYLLQFAIPLLAALPAGLAGLVAAELFGSASLRLVAGLSAGAASYLLISRVINRPWYTAMQQLLRH